MPILRVCHLGKYYPPSPGGIETHVRTLARAQAGLGASVRVYCMNHEVGATVVEGDGPVEVTRFGRAASAAKLDYCPGLVEALRRLDADVIHLHVPNPTMIAAALLAGVEAAVVVGYHSDVIRQKLRALLFRPMEHALYRRVRAILTTSPLYPGGSSFLRHYSERIRVLPLGIDLEPYLHPAAGVRAEARAIRARFAPDGPLWLCAGRQVYYKGFINAIRALTRVAGTLVLIGHGPDRPLLEAEAERLGVRDRVAFVGTLRHYLEVVPYYLAADALWFPSNARSEAFGLGQVEAMASGCPVINTAIPHSGVSWVSPHDRTGLTVPIDDPVALAEAANRLIAEPGLRERLAVAGRERASHEFDHRIMAERSLAIYRHVLAEAPAASPARLTPLRAGPPA